MIKFKHKHRTFRMRKRFTIEHWLELNQLDRTNPQMWPKIMSVGFNRPFYKFMDISEDSLVVGVSLVLHQVSAQRECKLVDFTKLTFGEFLDLDVYLVLGMEKHMDAILDLICVKKPKYIDEALWAITQYAHFRISTYRQYSGLFGLNDKGEQDDVDDESFNPQLIAKNWYKVIVNLAQNDITKLDEVTDQPLKKALNFMSLQKEQILEENMKQLQIKRNHDLQRNRK